MSLPRTLLSVALGLVGAGLLSVVAQATEPLTIENEFLRVTWDAGSSSLAIGTPPTGKTFASRIKLGGSGGRARAATVDDDKFGRGAELALDYPDGNRDAVRLFRHLPFALFSATLHNGGGEPAIVERVRRVSARLDLGRPTDELRVLGTGGLTTLEKNPGSYAYLAIVDPATRGGVVGGWLTHDRGSGVLFSPLEGGRPGIEARIDYGRLRIKAGQDARSETFALGWFDDARLGLEAYAEAVARHYDIRLPPQPAGYCTWYAEKHAGACDERHLAELAAFAARHLKPFGFQFVQIDDQWQAGISKNGPLRNFTTHRPDGPYPGGMQATAGNLRRLGLTPGIWFMPFAGTSYDPFFQGHPEWFAQAADGKPFETDWGGTCLDMTQPGAREHLRSVVHRMAHEWGYRLFKMDGLWTGTATRQMYVNDGYKDDHIGEARLHNPDVTQIEAFRTGLKLVRREAGPEVFLLGCCVAQNMRTFGGAFGLLDAMRVGPDTGAGQIGAAYGSRNYFLQGRVWQNDPDCVSVRAAMPLEQARLNASWTAIAGQLFYNSDWLPDLPPERLEILKRTLLPHGLAARPVDLFEHDPPRIWLLSDTGGQPRRDVVALYNWDAAHAATVACPAGRLGLPAAAQYVAFDFWADRFLPPFGEQLVAELPPASCRILAVRPAAPRPQLLGTSRHVTQGMVDVLAERWDAPAQTLCGESRLVAGDPYQLRIVLPAGDASWRARAVTFADADAAAGVQAELKQDGPQVRATITSPADRRVIWAVKFESPNPKSQVSKAKSQVSNLKSPIVNPGSLISDLKSQISDHIPHT